MNKTQRNKIILLIAFERYIEEDLSLLENPFTTICVNECNYSFTQLPKGAVHFEFEKKDHKFNGTFEFLKKEEGLIVFCKNPKTVWEGIDLAAIPCAVIVNFTRSLVMTIREIDIEFLYTWDENPNEGSFTEKSENETPSEDFGVDHYAKVIRGDIAAEKAELVDEMDEIMRKIEQAQSETTSRRKKAKFLVEFEKSDNETEDKAESLTQAQSETTSRRKEVKFSVESEKSDNETEDKAEGLARQEHQCEEFSFMSQIFGFFKFNKA